MRKKTGYLVLFLVLLNLSCATSTGQYRYKEILRDAKAGNIDFAFVKLDSYPKEFPDSIHVPKARFAVCEYYFQIKDYRSAIYKLRDYIIDFPEEKATIFAQLLLYKILSEYKKEPALTEKIKESLFSKSVFLVFSDAKVKHYKSSLNNIYRILNYVDKIEVFRNNEPFLKITP